MVSDAKPELFLPRRTPDDTPLDLTLPDQRVALLGPRGSGKSTLLRHLSTSALVLDDTTTEAAVALAQANPTARIFASSDAPIPGFTTYEIAPLSTRDVDDYLHHHTPDPALYELLANPAIHAYRKGTDFRLLAARMLRESGPEPVDGLMSIILNTNGGPSAVALLHRIETDLLPYGYAIRNPLYRQQVLAVRSLFEDTPESAAVPLADKIDAAEALDRLGAPRLLLPSDPAYWAPIGQGIELGRFPVTVHEFAAFVQQTGYQPWNWAEQQTHPSRPVNGVGWYQAVAYCQWAGGHLPTPAEWESALAGRYPWGDQEPTKLHANTNELQLGHPTPVGLFPRGNTPGTGIADLYGNVFEWVDEDVTREGEIEMKATRGASSRTYAGRPNGRWDSRSISHDNIGFRCARRR